MIVGSSGTITVTAPSGLIGGVVVVMSSASTAAGLLAVDAHANAHSPYPPSGIVASVTPTAIGEGAICVILGKGTGIQTGYAWGPAGYNFLDNAPYSGVAVLNVCGVLNPASGVAITGLAGLSGTPNLDSVSLIVKGTGSPVTLNITNPGTVTAEKLTIDFLGPIASPTITNTTNGTSVTINTTVAGTKHLLVDTGAYTALNDGTNVIGSVTHSGAVPFLTLKPGANTLQVSGAACTGSTLVTVSFAPAYL